MPEPIRVEDLPESRRVELAAAALEAGITADPLYDDGVGKWRPNVNAAEWSLLKRYCRWEAGTYRDIKPIWDTPLDALAAAALALGLEPRWRVVDRGVADEWLAAEEEMTRERPSRSMTPDGLADILNRHRKARAAIARALTGEA